MKENTSFVLSDSLKKVMHAAKKIEWITLIYMISSIIIMYFVLGSSQSMKTAWTEDILGTIPSIVFLISAGIYNKKPNNTFPYGYHRVFSIAFLAGSVALFGIGIFLFIDNIISLLKIEHPPVGSAYLLGSQIWMGWIMILVLLYSSIPSFFIGRKKRPYSTKLHNKILYTDAASQKADYRTSSAAIIGIIGLGFGLWWADAATAVLISLSVLKDGFTHSRTAIYNLMDRYPLQIQEQEKEPLIEDIKEFVKKWPSVQDANVRFREEGQVVYGEVAIVYKPQTDIPDAVEEGIKKLKEFNWRVYDVIISSVKSLPGW